MAKTHLSFGNQGFLAEKFYGRLYLKHAWAYYLFNKYARIQHLLHKMKYHYMPELAEMVGEKLGLALSSSEEEFQVDVIVPVPLHKAKLRRRGFNQSEHFARGVATYVGWEVLSDCVFRIKNTDTQTLKSRTQRWINVNDIFEVSNPESLKEKHVLLVDDVITTGATIEACGQVLSEVNLASLSIAAMAALK